MPRTGLSPAELRAAIDDEHQRLQQLLAGRDLEELDLAARDGKWSALENLRHLVFAEQVQLGRFLPESGQGMKPTTQDLRRRMDTAEVASLDELLARLSFVHDKTLVLVDDDRPVVHKAFDVNLRHLRAHIEAIETRLRLRR